jgi:hypothetical protein
MKRDSLQVDEEISVIGAVDRAIKSLSIDAQRRVLKYIVAKNNLNIDALANDDSTTTEESGKGLDHQRSESPADKREDFEPGLEGVSPVARRWMLRNDLTGEAISLLFSIGGDQIDLVAKNVPGNSKREKTRSVALLKGIAAYLSSGAARFTHEEFKEACLHYKAYDPGNFATYLKRFATELSGDKGVGYTLTARGMASATEMVKQLVDANGSTTNKK